MFNYLLLDCVVFEVTHPELWTVGAATMRMNIINREKTNFARYFALTVNCFPNLDLPCPLSTAPRTSILLIYIHHTSLLENLPQSKA